MEDRNRFERYRINAQIETIFRDRFTFRFIARRMCVGENFMAEHEFIPRLNCLGKQLNTHAQSSAFHVKTHKRNKWKLLP